MKSKVYFSKKITKENILKMYEVLNKDLKGKVAIKVHSGELGNKNFIQPKMYKDIVEKLNATIIESNTAYVGARDTTEKHRKLMENHGL